MNAPIEGPWLSILIPVYNVAPYLEECVLSIASQADDNVEVIALNDAATDGSGELLHKLRQNAFPRLKILEHSVNQGLSAARNHLLAAACGEYVWFIDSDDVVSAGAIAAARRIVREHAPDMIGCNFIKFGKRKRWKDRLLKARVRRTFEGPDGMVLTELESIIRGSFKSCNLHSWARLFRRDIQPDPDLFPVGRYFEDTHATPRLLLRVRSYYHESSPWILYREREGSVMRMLDVRKAADIGLALGGMHGEFRSRVENMGTGTKYEIAAFCGKMYTGSCRHMIKNDQRIFLSLRQEITSVLEQASPLSVWELVGLYALRPIRWWRAMKFLTWRFHPILAHRLGM